MAMRYWALGWGTLAFLAGCGQGAGEPAWWKLSSELDISAGMKLTAQGAQNGDKVGWGVAVAGNTAAVAAPSANSYRGSVSVYTRVSGTWTQQALLQASDGAAPDNFGQSVAMANGLIVVGAYAKASSAGAAYVYEGSGKTWTEHALVPNDAPATRLFGYSVATDGTTILVGAVWDADAGYHAGAVYVFTRVAGSWKQTAKLTRPVSTNENLGYCIAVDGDTILVGGNDAGSIWVFTRTAGQWSYAQSLSSFGTNFGLVGLGVSAAIQGDDAFAGAISDPEGGDYNGAVFWYRRVAGVWTNGLKLRSATPVTNQAFGWGVAVDHDTLLVGARGEDGIPGTVGSSYVFSRSGDAWVQEKHLDDPQNKVSDWVGTSVAVSGRSLLVGAPGADTTGAFYAYDVAGGAGGEPSNLAGAGGEPMLSAGGIGGAPTVLPGGAAGEPIAIAGGAGGTSSAGSPPNASPGGDGGAVPAPSPSVAGDDGAGDVASAAAGAAGERSGGAPGDSGCGCRMAPAGGQGDIALLALLGLAWMRRRRLRPDA